MLSILSRRGVNDPDFVETCEPISQHLYNDRMEASSNALVAGLGDA